MNLHQGRARTAPRTCRYERDKARKRKYKDKKFGWGQKPEDLKEEQQQACVSASATVGALFTVHLQAR